jgi:hypothetical protein
MRAPKAASPPLARLEKKPIRATGAARPLRPHLFENPSCISRRRALSSFCRLSSSFS